MVETTPFTLGERSADRHPQAGPPASSRSTTARALEQLYVDLADGQADVLRALRKDGANRADAGNGRAGPPARLLGAAAADVAPDVAFTDLGGDSLSALTFANLLHDIFDVDVPVGVIVSPASDLAAIAAYIDAQRAGGTKRPTYDAVHGRDATEVHASDLTLDKFLDEATLAAAPSLPRPEPGSPYRAADRGHRLPRALPRAAVAGADGSGRRQGHLPGPRQGRRRCPAAPRRDVRQRRSETARALPVTGGRPSRGARRRQGRGEPRPRPRHLATAGRHRRPDRRPRRAGQPRAALQPAVRTQRRRHRGADPHRPDDPDQAVRLRLDDRCR